jgi:antirestriction protein ArdC
VIQVLLGHAKLDTTALYTQGELRHSGYIGHWIKLLKSDPRAIFTAASKASQAADYLRSLSEARNEVPCLG